MPLYLIAFGSAGYGEWLALTALPSMLTLSDFGIGAAAATAATHAMVRGDWERARQVLSSAWVGVTAASSVACALAVVAANISDVAGLLGLSSIGEAEADAIFVLSALQVMAALQASLCEGGFRSLSKYPEGIRRISAARLVTSGSGVTVALGTSSQVATAVALLVAQVVVTLLLFAQLRKHALERLFVLSAARWTCAMQLVRPSLGGMAFPLGNAVTTQVTTLIVARALGSTAVVELAAVRVVSSAVRQIIGMFTSGFLPAVTEAVGRRQGAEVERLARQVRRNGMLTAVALGLAIVAINEPLFRLWTGGIVVPEVTFVALMVLTVSFDVPYLTHSVVAVAANRQQEIAPWFLLGSALSIVAAFLTASDLGLIAIPICLLLVDVTTTPAAVRAARSATRLAFGPNPAQHETPTS